MNTMYKTLNVRVKAMKTLVLLFPVLFVATASAHAVSVSVGSGQSSNCGQVKVDINVSGASNLGAFGMTLNFNSTNLALQSVSPGSATSSWAMLDGNEQSAGKITIGGFKGTGTAVNGSGVLASVTFSCVNCPSTTSLTVSNLTDGLAGASSSPGTITCQQADEDTTPPTPNPMTWATAPYASGQTTVKMTASVASDKHGVQYYFDETTGNPGASDSGWQDSPSYTDTGLSPCVSYRYRVKARDKSAFQNETSYSVEKTVKTECPAEGEGEVSREGEGEEGESPAGRACYSLDEGAGTTANDGCGSRTATLSGAASWGTSSQSVRGKSCLILDSPGEGLRLPDDAINNMPAGTVMLWIYQTVRLDVNQYFIAKDNPYIRAIFDVYIAPDGHIRTNIGGADTYAGSKAVVPLNKWTHFALTWDGTTKRVYINGAFDSSGGAASVENTKTATYIGRSATDVAWQFNGRIDDVRILDRALSAGEIVGEVGSVPPPETEGESPDDDGDDGSNDGEDDDNGNSDDDEDDSADDDSAGFCGALGCNKALVTKDGMKRLLGDWLLIGISLMGLAASRKFMVS